VHDLIPISRNFGDAMSPSTTDHVLRIDVEGRDGGARAGDQRSSQVAVTLERLAARQVDAASVRARAEAGNVEFGAELHVDGRRAGDGDLAADA